MADQKYYYIPFVPKSSINYLYLFRLIDLAEYSEEHKAPTQIQYLSASNLAEMLGVSPATATRLLNNTDYQPFFSVNKAFSTISLKNDFQKTTEKRAFVRLTRKEVELIRKVKEPLFCRYIIYLRYYCGFQKDKQDFTADQFLSACGYSTKSNKYKDLLCNYNRLLADNGIIKIKRYTDERGHLRNTYTFLLE